MDFNIPGLLHSGVKQLHSASVRELIQKIENHPNRHALQRDLQQSQSFNPFSQESKEMIHEVGNIELCELLDMEHKAQCKVCLSYWGRRHRLLHTSCETEQRRTRNLSSTPWISAPHREFAQEEMQEEVLLGYPRPVHSRREVPQEHV